MVIADDAVGTEQGVGPSAVWSNQLQGVLICPELFNSLQRAESQHLTESTVEMMQCRFIAAEYNMLELSAFR